MSSNPGPETPTTPVADPKTRAAPAPANTVTPAGGSIPADARHDPPPDHDEPSDVDRRPRPLIERLGMAAIALVLAGLFAVVAVAAFTGGELFLATMGVIGCLMVLWVGGLSLVRG